MRTERIALLLDGHARPPEEGTWWGTVSALDRGAWGAFVFAAWI